MKKGLTIAVSVMAALSLAACGNNKQSDELKKLRAEHSSLVKQSKQASHKHKQKKHSTKSKRETKQSASKSNTDSQSSANKQSNQQRQKPTNSGQQAATQPNNSGNNNASSANQTNAANNLEWDGTRRRDSFKSDADFQRYNAWHQGYNYDPNTGNMTPLDQQQLNQMRQEMNKDGGQSFQ